jgi:hypothetical protein
MQRLPETAHRCILPEAGSSERKGTSLAGRWFLIISFHMNIVDIS